MDELIVRRLLEAIAPEQVALALAAADEVSDRQSRSTRALKLRIERARYEAIRAERAFHACEPDNRLVARSLETRWEEKLRELKDAEAELAEHVVPSSEPSREQLEALARDLPKLWAADTTTDRDRKRLLRTMIADVTLTSQPEGRELQVGIRWRSGAAEQHTIQRPPKPADAKRTPSEVIELIKRLAAEHTNAQIAEQLGAAGMCTSTGLPFDEKAVRWLRWRYRIGPSQLLRDGELTVNQTTERLGVSVGTVYAWISTGKLAARRGPANRLYIPFPPHVEQQCRKLVASSIHLPAETKIRSAGGAV
ncbi:MAG: helix-turn-helix domain-containing protein [Solirubrobacteraceae bacterium]